MTMKARWVAGPCAVCAIALVLSVAGQASASAEQTSGATIQGTITDDTGAVLPGVSVTATHTQSERSRTVVSDARGDYRITRLEAGNYDVQAMLPGFRTNPTSVTVGEGVSSLDIVLGIAPLAETVMVTRTEQELSAVSTSVAVVGRETIEVGQRRASLDESLRGIPGLLVQNRRSYSISGGIGLAIRRPQSRFGIRGLALLQDGIPITTADGTTEPGNVDIGSMGRIDVIRGPQFRAVWQCGRGCHQCHDRVQPGAPCHVRAGHPVRELRLQPATAEGHGTRGRHRLPRERQSFRDRRVQRPEPSRDPPGERRRSQSAIVGDRDPRGVQLL